MSPGIPTVPAQGHSWPSARRVGCAKIQRTSQRRVPSEHAAFAVFLVPTRVGPWAGGNWGNAVAFNFHREAGEKSSAARGCLTHSLAYSHAVFTARRLSRTSCHQQKDDATSPVSGNLCHTTLGLGLSSIFSKILARRISEHCTIKNGVYQGPRLGPISM